MQAVLLQISSFALKTIPTLIQLPSIIVICTMPSGTLATILHTDIYLIDQILKNRYDAGGTLLDAGCGGGRNLSWFVEQPNMDIYAVDMEPDHINQLPAFYPSLKREQLICTPLQSLPFKDAFFDHIICSAVLHFAESKTMFLHMFEQLYRVLKPGGILFIRMAADMGIENRIVPLGNGKYALPDGSDRFLLTKPLLEELFQLYPLTLIEPVKTTNVQDLRCMTTLVMQKQ